MIESALPEEERALLDLLAAQPDWVLVRSETFVEVTGNDVGIRFSAERSPTIVTKELPDGYPYALAKVVWCCVRYGPSVWWREGLLTTAAQWDRIGVTDEARSWADVVGWMRLAPRELLSLAASTFSDLRSGVRTDDDARPAAESLIETVLTAPTYSRMSGFLQHLAEPQRTVAEEMLAAGFEIEVFWGPEQMDVWHLTLRRGPVRIEFHIERGVTDGISISHDHRRPPPRGDAWSPFGYVRLAWARRTGVLDRATDPLDSPAIFDTVHYRDWPAVTAWLVSATDADVAAIDDLAAEVRQLRIIESGRAPRTTTHEERIAAAERALGPGG